MFEKILIANRGEIACRIIKTAKRMGIQTVTVYSDADKNSLHATQADQAIHIGPSPSSESYLQIEKIIQVAKESGAEAIHPGYGFLSENPEFARKCKESGIEFIGPSAESIKEMGQKDVAKRIMEVAGLPVIPGYHGENQDIENLVEIAEKIGFPVLIKASAGGGGKGMRIVNKKSEFVDSIQAVQRESQSSFGDQRCIIEKYLPKTRHIEVQIFGDKKGNYVHLFERDCSIQRRYQKVIEEAPAPGISDEMRNKLGDIAIQVAKAVDYENAGTVEFIADISNGFSIDSIYFMEMNTRLQVEHPVTELITGQDLVEWQLRIAAGESLPLKQSDLQIKGHAIEARVYAEDPANEFLPSIGKLDYFELPFGDIRIDSGVRQGDVITQFYDPMIAKLISYVESRREAINRLNTVLSGSYITGVKSNISFVRNVLKHDKFQSGEVETGLVDKNIDQFTETQSPSLEITAVAALASLGLLDCPDSESPWTFIRGWRNWGKSKCFAKVSCGNEIHDFQIDVIDNQNFVVQEGKILTNVVLIENIEGILNLKINDSEESVKIIHLNDYISIFKDGEMYDFVIPDIDYSEIGDEGASSRVIAQIPSVVKEIKVKEDDQVVKGQKLLVLEAMKMEHTVYSQQEGIVSDIFVKVGQQVKESEVLIKFEEESDATKS